MIIDQLRKRFSNEEACRWFFELVLLKQYPVQSDSIAILRPVIESFVEKRQTLKLINCMPI